MEHIMLEYSTNIQRTAAAKITQLSDIKYG